MWNQKPSFRFEIANFSQKESPMTSNLFLSGGCEWCVTVYPKGDYTVDDNDHLSLLLSVANSISLPFGWERVADFYFLVLNQSNKELYRSSIGPPSSLFCNETPSLGFAKALPLSKFDQEKGFLENDILIIEVYIKLLKVYDGEEDENVSKKKNTFDINGFRVFASQVASVKKLFAEHPDIAVDIRSNNIKEVKTTYMNILLGLIDTLDKPSQILSEAELRNADSELRELTEEGFKLDWLKLRLEEVSLGRKKEVSDIELVDQKIENVELTLSEVKANDDKEEKMNSTACDDEFASAKVSSFQFIDVFVKRCFLSCFSISHVRD
ncbi:unnamed protein product [Cochlearia groenlandica]